MNRKVNGMSSVRVGFMGALLGYWNGVRRQVITRKELIDFIDQWKPGERGTTGLELRAPSWLTNDKSLTVGRGSYKLPWDEYDAWTAGQNAKPAVAPVNSVPEATIASAVSTLSLAPVSNDENVSAETLTSAE